MPIAVGTATYEYPICAVLGPRGSGKTLMLTAIADNAHSIGFNVFTNFTLKGIPHTKLKGKEIEAKANEIKNGVLLIDEMHEVSDSYDPFAATPKQVATFAAQSRKRQITIFYSAQDLMQVAVRMRRLTDLVVEMYANEHKGYHDYRIMTKDMPHEVIKDFSTLYGAPFFDKYDTNEIITEDDDNE